MLGMMNMFGETAMLGSGVIVYRWITLGFCSEQGVKYCLSKCIYGARARVFAIVRIAL